MPPRSADGEERRRSLAGCALQGSPLRAAAVPGCHPTLGTGHTAPRGCAVRTVRGALRSRSLRAPLPAVVRKGGAPAAGARASPAGLGQSCAPRWGFPAGIRAVPSSPPDSSRSLSARCAGHPRAQTCSQPCSVPLVTHTRGVPGGSSAALPSLH